MIKKLLIILSIVLFPSLSWGAACSWVANAATVADPYDHVDMQNCIDEAAAKTGAVTITIPGEPVSWDNNVLVTMASLTDVTSLTIQGSGATTVITDTGTSTTSGDARLFKVVTTSGKIFRLSNMVITPNISTGGDTTASNGIVRIEGTGTSNIIDKITVNDYKNHKVLVLTGETEGVVYDCAFTKSSGTAGSGNPIVVVGKTGNDDSLWESQGFTPGTEHAWYIEGSTFTASTANNGSYDSYGGARVVFRYNQTWGGGVGGHGNDSGSYAATHTQEIYNNKLYRYCDFDDSCGADGLEFVDWRGGTGVMFNNDFSSHTAYPAKAENYRSCPYHYGQATNASPSTSILNAAVGENFDASGLEVTDGNYIFNQTKEAYCEILSHTADTITCASVLSGGKSWEAGDYYSYFYFSTLQDDLGCDGLSSADGNVAGKSGWICKQQIGSTHDGVGYTYKPVYAWGNTHKGSTGGFIRTNTATCSRDSTYHTVENKTFFNCDSAADCKSDTDAVKDPEVGIGDGWAYPGMYDCPHPKTGLTGSCTTTAGITGYNVETAHTVTASVTGTGCSMTPTGEEIIGDTEDSSTYTATVNTGHKATWSIDGAAAVAVANGGTHQFTNVTADHTIAITCAIQGRVGWRVP